MTSTPAPHHRSHMAAMAGLAFLMVGTAADVASPHMLTLASILGNAQFIQGEISFNISNTTQLPHLLVAQEMAHLGNQGSATHGGAHILLKQQQVRLPDLVLVGQLKIDDKWTSLVRIPVTYTQTIVHHDP